MKPPEETLIFAGKIGRPVGLSGEMRFFYHGNRELIPSLPATVHVGFNPADAEPVELERMSQKANRRHIRFTGVSDRTAADSYKNMSLYIMQDKLPETGSDEYYFYELKGLRVFSDTGRELGKVHEIYELPTTEAVEIDLFHRGLVMMPFGKEWVESVDLKNQRMTVFHDKLQELF
jgi:16S rRNA processing protein RimM